MSTINEIILEIFKYIKYEEENLQKLDRKQDKLSDAAHQLEEGANADYEQRLAYIDAVQKMRRYRAGVVSHHNYISGLQIRYMEMNNKLSLEDK